MPDLVIGCMKGYKLYNKVREMEKKNTVNLEALLS